MADSKYRDWLRRILLSFHWWEVSIEHTEHHLISGWGLTKLLTQWTIVRIADLLEESLHSQDMISDFPCQLVKTQLED